MTALKFLSATIKVEYGWNHGANLSLHPNADELLWDGAFSFAEQKKCKMQNAKCKMTPSVFVFDESTSFKEVGKGL